MDAVAVSSLVWLAVWGVTVGSLWLPRRYCSWLVRTAGTSVAGVGFLAVAVHLAGVLLFALAAFLINGLVVGDSPMWFVALLFVLAGMVYSPLVGLGLPARSLPPFADIRLTLEEAGATLGQERAVAWVGGLLAFPGMTAILAGAAILFGW
ncbi:hypothetical protein [Actinomadura chokoriensis]|uniref:DUF2269 family protein n=1 Tax=Actinomadura chokoriensis TaxID=454156 RepID=A0ABV4RAZ0_9ACTN